MRRRKLDSVRERAEMALLGLLLFAPAPTEGLEADHFFYPWNAAVFEAIQLGADRSSITSKLEETGSIENLEYVGREDYLAQLLVAGATCTAQLSDLIALIKRCPRCHR